MRRPFTSAVHHRLIQLRIERAKNLLANKHNPQCEDYQLRNFAKARS